ncbi:phage tail protein [Bartonella harrusi]|uniref:Phage tail protein n=1 Tax=Bartonella harrusi TaxID=2961895 RepID=A0ABY5EVZ9_9HYPH|nr:phage tail protein [Bartonella harrusi]UTO27982.1 phage tail protein [Bartonella harrusi]UTO28043.1 phage tail protein [Bartonella harrusi]
MQDPLMMLGPHQFYVDWLNFQSFEEEFSASWVSMERFGKAPSLQFTGYGNDAKTIHGVWFPVPSWLGGKTALQPIVQFAGHSQTSPVTTQATDKNKQSASVYHHQNVTVHVNGARDPLATGRAVSHALQRAKANALHGGTE